MTDNDDSSLDHIPPIIPSRDEAASRKPAGKKRGAGKKSRRGGGAGPLAGFFIAIGLAVAGVACAWAWRLQQELDASGVLLAEYEARIGDLEDRLSDTDEGMNQSAATVSVKIKELYSEVDKLWASAWRRNKARIEELEKSSAAHDGRLTGLSETDREYAARLRSLGADLDELRGIAGDLERLIAGVEADRELIGRLGEEMGRATLEVTKLQKRVRTGEEWQNSVDGFRRQVNQNLLQLREDLSRLRNAGAGG